MRKLRETNLEDKRLEFNKKIHDAIVNADLSNKKVVKKMEPMIKSVEQAIQEGYDRPNISGQADWLASAKNYYENEKGRQTVDVQPPEIMETQTLSFDGTKIVSYPDKIQLTFQGKTKTLVKGNGIHEAVISPDGRTVAYFTENPGMGSRTEILTVDVKRERIKKVASVGSCHTLLFSLDGKTIYFQEKPADNKSMSEIRRIPVSGGTPKSLGKGSLLSTILVSGDYKGDLVIYKKTSHHLGTADLKCPYVVDESNGREIGRIKDLACK